MDEYESGWDPGIKKYFRKIINSFFMGLLWLMGIVTAGIFFKLGEVRSGVKWYNILFYGISALSFFLLIRYYYRSWNKKTD